MVKHKYFSPMIKLNSIQNHNLLDIYVPCCRSQGRTKVKYLNWHFIERNYS